MRIGFDAKRAVQNFTGLGNYSRYLIEIICRFHTGNTYLLYAPKYSPSKQLDSLLDKFELECRYPQGLWKKIKSLWRTFGITRQLTKDSIDIYHGLSNELPLNIRKAKGTKSVVTIHDLIFIRFPQYYSAIDRRLYRYKYGKSCKNADAIIAISECTKRDIISYFHISPAKIRTIYQGCDRSFSAIAPDKTNNEAKEKFILTDRYILIVGSVDEGKNALLAV